MVHFFLVASLGAFLVLWLLKQTKHVVIFFHLITLILAFFEAKNGYCDCGKLPTVLFELLLRVLPGENPSLEFVLYLRFSFLCFWFFHVVEYNFE